MDAFDLCAARRQTLLVGVGFISGILIHKGLFIWGEWHVQAPRIFLVHLALYVGCPVLTSVSQGSLVGSILGDVVSWSHGYLPGLLTSIILYRALFHPLTRAGFPGPRYARITKLWHLWACRKSKNHRVLDNLYKEYGSFVRTGPAEITVFHPDVFMAIDGPRSECIKAEWYDLLRPSQALGLTRDKSVHAARRREWNSGFTTKALVEHEAKILKHVDQLDQCVQADSKADKVTDMRNLLYWFSFDSMGDFVFSKPFCMLENRQWHHIIIRLQRALSLLGPFSPTPWLVQIAFQLGPRVGVLKDWFDLLAWSKAQMCDRIQNGSANQSQDLAYYLMEKDTRGLDSERLLWLEGDSILAIVAGSEPTAVALVAVFCELGKHPEHAEQIHAELTDVDVTDLKTLVSLPHLNAVIKESMRLHPGILTGGYRKTTRNGITIGDRFIPPNTTIVAPRYSIGRREDCFERASEFIPERWSSRPEMVLNVAAYAPFGTGHHSCPGRTMATGTMRFAVARILKKYRFRAAPGDLSLSAMQTAKDQFTSNPGELKLCFEVRDEAEL